MTHTMDNDLCVYIFIFKDLFQQSRDVDECSLQNTVKPVLSGHSKIDKTMVVIANGSLMKVQSIAECSLWSILQYF